MSQPSLRLCSRGGHDWTDAPDAAIVSRRCVRCPAIGAPCPDCDGHGIVEIGDRLPECVRCDGTGTVEVVEIPLAAVERLRKTRDRFVWLLNETSHQWGTKPDAAIREIDALIELGAEDGKITGRSIAEIARSIRADRMAERDERRAQKGPRPGARPGAMTGDSPAASQGKGGPNIADIRDKA